MHRILEFKKKNVLFIILTPVYSFVSIKILCPKSIEKFRICFLNRLENLKNLHQKRKKTKKLSLEPAVAGLVFKFINEILNCVW